MSLGANGEDECTITGSKEVSVVTATPDHRKDTKAMERFHIPIKSKSKSKQDS